MDALSAENIDGLLYVERGMRRRLTGADVSHALSDLLAQEAIASCRAATDGEPARGRPDWYELAAFRSALGPRGTLDLASPPDCASVP